MNLSSLEIIQSDLDWDKVFNLYASGHSRLGITESATSEGCSVDPFSKEDVEQVFYLKPVTKEDRRFYFRGKLKDGRYCALFAEDTSGSGPFGVFTPWSYHHGMALVSTAEEIQVPSGYFGVFNK